MIVLAVVLAVLILIALLRIGVTAEYNADGFFLTAHAGLLSIRLFPGDQKPKVKKRVRKAPKIKMPGKLKPFLDMIAAAKISLERMRRKLLIKELTIHFTAAGDDPAMTAIMYGAANAVFSSLTPLLENSFRIRKRDLVTFADFLAPEHTVYFNAVISMAVWEAAYTGIVLLPPSARLIKSMIVRKDRRDRKEGKEHGKASNQ